MNKKSGNPDTYLKVFSMKDIYFKTYSLVHVQFITRLYCALSCSFEDIKNFIRENNNIIKIYKMK